ncbi:hypothetical protein JZ751_001319 [Albula glossodonta]|uniref:Uncharacterized protein n=1 Tax=Albula glossodonta TaxID=121402 RepID=A0A8T2PTJ5_9TELE|nr:hypothetical protein JZ751_001319 [Albula glossodonta]
MTLFYKPVDAGDISERKLNDKNTNSPSNSVLHLMDYAGQDSLELEVGTDIKHVSESGGWGSGRILTQDTVERDSGNDSVSEDRDCGSSRSQPPVPPPSLKSDTSRWTVTAGKGHQPPVQVTTL